MYPGLADTRLGVTSDAALTRGRPRGEGPGLMSVAGVMSASGSRDDVTEPSQMSTGVWTNERRVLRVLTNERRVLRVLTNERRGYLPGDHPQVTRPGRSQRTGSCQRADKLLH